jgi:hypothetical protein
MKRMPSPAELALTASAVAITGGIAFFLTTRKGGVLTGTYANPLPVPSSDAVAKRVPAVAERLQRVWKDVTGDDMPPQALEIALAQAWLESGVAEAGGGGWWTDKTDKGQGNMVGSGNLGARQCSKPTDSGDYYTCVPYGDTVPQPDGSSKAIDASFMYFKAGKTPDGVHRDAGDAAAWRFITDITKTWPALTELKSGDVMVYAKRQGPKAQGGNGYYQGFGATMDERVSGYARAIASHIPAVAAALGHKKVYAKIEPELLASGPKHAAVTAGIQLAGAEIARALHIAGLLPRARAIPGSRGHVVWYVERSDLGSGPPRDVVISEQEAIEQDAAVRAANRSEVAVEGAGTIAASILIGLFVAAGAVLAVATKRASDLREKLRAAGFEIVSTNAQFGWRAIHPDDPDMKRIESIVGDNALMTKMIGAGLNFIKLAQKPVSGYASSRWARRSPPIGDLAEDILSTGNEVLQTIDKLTPDKKDAPVAPGAPAPAATSPAPAPATQPTSVSPTAVTIAVASGAAVAVLLTVAAAWRIAKPRLGEARGYPLFAWMSTLPDDAVRTLRSGVPLTEDQIRSLTPAQCETIVDHALIASKDGVPDPSTWFLTGDDRVVLVGTAEAVQAVSTATVGVVALVGAILLYQTLSKQASDISERAGQAFTALADSGPAAAHNAWKNPECSDPNDPLCAKRAPGPHQLECQDPNDPLCAKAAQTPMAGTKPRWLRWIKPDVGDGQVQSDASSAKKIVDGIADKYASKDAAKVVGATTTGVLTGLSIGTALGTAFPGLGNVVGAAVGAIVGALAGLISGLLGLGPSPEQVALAAEINKFNQRVHAALLTVPPEARAKLGGILVDSMRKHVGPYPICVGPNAAGDADIACVMTDIDGIREAASSLDADVQKWILQYQAEASTARAKTYKRVAATAGGITLAALAALAVAAKTGVVALGDAEPKYPEFQWMTGFPEDAIRTLRSGAPLDAASLRRLTKDQRRTLATHAHLETKDGAIDLASWSIGA